MEQQHMISVNSFIHSYSLYILSKLFLYIYPSLKQSGFYIRIINCLIFAALFVATIATSPDFAILLFSLVTLKNASDIIQSSETSQLTNTGCKQ